MKTTRVSSTATGKDRNVEAQIPTMAMKARRMKMTAPRADEVLPERRGRVKHLDPVLERELRPD